MGKGLKEKQILVIVKEPGKVPEVEPLFTNSLAAFQDAVGGRIETLTLSADLVIVCNADARVLGMAENVNIFGVGFAGPVVAVGAKGDRFVSLKASLVPYVLQQLGG